MTWPFVLLLHGPTSAGRDHWQGWLAHELALAGATVQSPVLSDPDHPSPDTWRDELIHHLQAAPQATRRVVVAHGAGATLWLHHAAHAPLDDHTLRVDSVLLVSPSTTPFAPPPLDPAGIRRAASWTQLAVGHDDAHLPVADAVAMAATLKIDLDVIPEGGHLDTHTGYGPWPSALAWVKNRHTRLVAV